MDAQYPRSIWQVTHDGRRKKPVYAAVMIINMPSREPYEIGVSGSRFVEADESTVELPDTSDLWALPGLADCHAHVTMTSLREFDAITDESMRTAIPINTWAHLEHGVLLILDKGGKSDTTLVTLDHDADLRPFTETAGAMISPPGGYYGNGFGTEVEPDALVEHIRTKAATRGGWVKLVGDWPRRGQGPVNNWPQDVLTEAVRAVHDAGARVAIHSMAHSASDAVAAGVDSIEHGPFLTESDLKILAARGGAWVPTIVNMLFLRDMLGVESSGGKMFVTGLERMRENLPLAESLGVTVLAGTDMAVPHGEVATEAVLLKEYGLSDAAATAATSTAAYRYVGRPTQPTVGAEADVVFFRDNPLEGVETLAEPVIIMRRGKIVRSTRG
ncbi:MAG: amidohydrolase family protein [Acidimicrobiia bacterium]|nr:amidohydrolase family protein [Acidimicrobiia bacterium]